MAEEPGKIKSKCRGCGADIIWIKMKTGSNMPVDPKTISLISKDGLMISGYMPHWATCPEAKMFKQKTCQKKMSSQN